MNKIFCLVHESFTVHVRGVGQWTNKLYNFFQVKSLALDKIICFAFPPEEIH